MFYIKLPQYNTQFNLYFIHSKLLYLNQIKCHFNHCEFKYYLKLRYFIEVNDKLLETSSHF